jgi:hypothetical protein
MQAAWSLALLSYIFFGGIRDFDTAFEIKAKEAFGFSAPAFRRRLPA